MATNLSLFFLGPFPLFQMTPHSGEQFQKKNRHQERKRDTTIIMSKPHFFGTCKKKRNRDIRRFKLVSYKQHSSSLLLGMRLEETFLGRKKTPTSETIRSRFCSFWDSWGGDHWLHYGSISEEAVKPESSLAPWWGTTLGWRGGGFKGRFGVKKMGGGKLLNSKMGMGWEWWWWEDNLNRFLRFYFLKTFI